MTLPKYEPIGGNWHRAWFPSGAYLDVEITRERSWPGIGSGDPPGEVHRPLYEDAAARVHRLRVLDVGCGAGYGTKILSEWCTSAIGTDIDLAALTFAAEAYEDPSGPSYGPPPAARMLSYDAVVCIEVIEHVEDDRGFARSLHDALVPGGMLYLSTPEYDSKRVISEWHCREYTWDQLHALLSEAGFVDLERRTVNAFRESIVLTARRPE